MKRSITLLSLLATALLATLPLMHDEAGQDHYPSRPVKMIVPYRAGGPTDVPAPLVPHITQLPRCAVPGGKALVVERLLGVDHRAGLALLANDVEMMVSVGGKERSEAEFRELFAQAGLRISRIIGPVDTGGQVIIEGRFANI